MNLSVQLIIFFGSLGYLTITLAIFFTLKRAKSSIDWLVPIYGVYSFLCLIPVLIEDPHKPKFIQGNILLLTAVLQYVINSVLSSFCTSQYSLSVAGRLILYFNTISLKTRLFLSGKLPLVPMIVVFLHYFILIESTCYYTNREKVKLFLDKEAS